MAERSTQERTRRKFARRQWARRWVVLRAVLVAVLLVGATGFGIYALYFSSWLQVEGATVAGTSQLTDDEVLAAAEVPTGEALIRADLEAIEARVKKLTAVKSVDVSREWPHDIHIEVHELDPIAVVGVGTDYAFLADTGDTYTFGAMPKQAPAALPRVEVSSGADRLALQEAADVVGALDPAVASLVDHLKVETADQIQLVLSEDRLVEWGSADLSDEKARVLLDLLDAKPDATVYDVSVPSMPATR
ncbi:FtsQ-type POTRA domain-containing protein [Nocardioides humilatus]|uniref:FtsQ-type POTRA domain-containing protein n=1 Tax=Nocardioides humilatus TaxID=2607660 RepID=A0A5B1LBT2_9ACTN|nr:FtsQ-type POTRA domain-containing protein [Nocardioides humilatus]KAA1417916.1 FtsQ-type POTRA domain-containing protein [Nocardioides humilatus]